MGGLPGILVHCGILSAVILSIVNTQYTAPESELSSISSVVASLPIFAALAYAAWVFAKGKARNAIGIVAALLTLAAAALLLIAACFSIVRA
jgi:ABC-type proline/glycine betaine transport system permease subunit